MPSACARSGDALDSRRESGSGSRGVAKPDGSQRNGSRRLRTSRLCPTVLRQFHLSGGKLEQAAPGNRQGRVVSWRALSKRPLHRDQHEPSCRGSRRVLQQARYMRAMDQRGTGAIKWTRPSCRTLAASAVRLQLHALAYNLGNFLRTLAAPEPIEDWSLTSLKEQLIKIGAKVVSHGRYIAFQIAEVAIPRQMFQEFFAAHCATTAATTLAPA